MKNFLSWVKPLGRLGHDYLQPTSSYNYYAKRKYSKKPKKRKLDKSLRKCLQQFRVFKDLIGVNDLIIMIKEFQIEKKRKEESPWWKPFLENGVKLLNVFSHLASPESDKCITSMVNQIYQEEAALLIVGMLSVIASLLSRFDKLKGDQSGIFELLRDMFHLSEHVISRNIPKEKIMPAIELIFQGSIYCASQLESEKSSSLVKAPRNSETLSNIRRKVNKLFSEPLYPRPAVGIEDQVREIVNILERPRESSVAVVINGFGGTGKTTLAENVLAKVNLYRYNWTKVEIAQEEEKNDFKTLQQKILKDCFPTYNNGQPKELTDCKDGRNQLIKASKCGKAKPIFIFIDNASRSVDLKELLPTCTEFLPPCSRILLTTRKLAATNMFVKPPKLVRESHSVKPLGEDDAMKILSRDPSNHGNVEKNNIKGILSISTAVPLALHIFSAHLHKQSLSPLLQREEEKLTDSLVDFVYGELDDSTREAFLDICCFFRNWKRQDVEYIVGATPVTSLIRAGLITLIPSEEIIYFKEADEQLFLHDVVVAKGQSLAKDTRIMDFQSLCEAEDEQRLDKIKGIWLVNEESNHVLQERHLSSMTKSLRVLALGDRMKFGKAEEMHFKELRFLRTGGSIPQLPLKLEALTNLKVFHGPFSIRGDVIMYKLPSSLLAMRVIERSVKEKSESPEVVRDLQCNKLEKLHFTGSWELRILLEGPNKLDALRTFILDDFTSMENLPDQICRLPALSVLSITKAESLNRLPEWFDQLTTLKQLRISHSSALKALPSAIGQFVALTHMDLEGCCTLDSVPSYFENLTALSHLSLGGCTRLETLPPTFGYLKALKYLNLASCEMLEALPPSFRYLSALKHLCLNQCKMLKTLPLYFGELTALEYLSMSQCTMLLELPESFGCLSALKYLCLRECTNVSTLSHNFGQLKALEYLNLCHCKSLTITPAVLKELRALKCLECSPEVEEKLEGEVREEVLIVAD